MFSQREKKETPLRSYTRSRSRRPRRLCSIIEIVLFGTDLVSVRLKLISNRMERVSSIPRFFDDNYSSPPSPSSPLNERRRDVVNGSYKEGSHVRRATGGRQVALSPWYSETETDTVALKSTSSSVCLFPRGCLGR